MSHLNLHEQDQLSKLQYFWRDYGKYIIGFILVAIIVYLSNAIWQWKVRAKNMDVAITYAQFTENVNKNNVNAAYKIAYLMQKKYPKAAYTIFANMWSAKIAFSVNDLPKAENFLQWVIVNSKDKALSDIARLRLADVYIDENKIQKAQEILSNISKVSKELLPLYHEKNGDLSLVQNNKIMARNMYKLAISTAAGNVELLQEIQTKLDGLGN